MADYETLFLLTTISEYKVGYIETIATEYSRPDLSEKYGCPGRPDLWHINCMYSCGGSQSKPESKQDIVNWALDRPYTYVVIEKAFYDEYKTEVDNFIRSGKKIYLLTFRSGGMSIDGHCYEIQFKEITVDSTIGDGEGDKMIYQINTQKNLRGTVEKVAGCGELGGWLWHLTAPVQKDIYYGCADTIPATWIDATGNEQMALIKKGTWYPNDIALDNNLTGVFGEQYVRLEDVDIISEIPGYTTQLRYPKDYIVPLIGAVVVLTAIGALGYVALKKVKVI